MLRPMKHSLGAEYCLSRKVLLSCLLVPDSPDALLVSDSPDALLAPDSPDASVSTSLAGGVPPKIYGTNKSTRPQGATERRSPPLLFVSTVRVPLLRRPARIVVRFSKNLGERRESSIFFLRDLLFAASQTQSVLMAQPEIPAFGDWETTGNTPYTQKFEDARKNKKTGIPSHPNEPRRHPEPPLKPPLHPAAYTPDPREQDPRNPPHGRRTETDPHHRESAPQRHANPQQEQGGNASARRSPYRPAAGSASPMQLNNPSKPKHRTAGMPTPERRASSEGHGQHTPGRSRMKQSGLGYQPEEEVAVPPFGEWDEANAASGEKYSGIFNRVRNDKLSPNSSTRQPSSTNHSKENKVQQTCPCCIL